MICAFCHREKCVCFNTEVLLETWYCSCCQSKRYGRPWVYGVPLCLRCLLVYGESPRQDLAYKQKAEEFLRSHSVGKAIARILSEKESPSC